MLQHTECASPLVFEVEGGQLSVTGRSYREQVRCLHSHLFTHLVAAKLGISLKC